MRRPQRRWLPDSVSMARQVVAAAHNELAAMHLLPGGPATQLTCSTATRGSCARWGRALICSSQAHTVGLPLRERARSMFQKSARVRHETGSDQPSNPLVSIVRVKENR
jgi:hypothetical protein